MIKIRHCEAMDRSLMSKRWSTARQSDTFALRYTEIASCLAMTEKRLNRLK